MSDDEDYLESNLSGEESSSESDGSEISSDTSSETSLEELEELEDLDEDELGTYHILDWDNQLKSKMDELSNSLAEKNVTTEEYRREMLRTNYWNMKRSRKYIVSDEDKEIIDKVRRNIEEIKLKFNNGEITEQVFNDKYDEFIRLEYNILRVSEQITSDKKEYIPPPENEAERVAMLMNDLEMYHMKEVKYMKKIGDKYNIYPPTLPEGYTGEDIQDYSDKLNTDLELPYNRSIDNYIKAYDTFKQKVLSIAPSYVIVDRVWGQSSDAKANEPSYIFNMIKKEGTNLSRVLGNEKRFNLLTENEEIQFQTGMWKEITDKLRRMSREDLLSCIPNRTFKYMSYIERLRENKQKMLKFREHPKDYEELRNILEEDSKYYRIEANKLFRNYKYNRPFVYDKGYGKTSDAKHRITGSPQVYLQNGKVKYLAFKENVDRNDVGDLSNFITVKPIDDELYNEISEREGNNTSVVDIWELRVYLAEINSSFKEKINVVKRYESFNDYLSDFKDILHENLKKIPVASQEVLADKIRKINHYLNTGEDPDIYTETGQLPISDIFNKSDEIIELRKNGKAKLIQYILEYIEHDSQKLDDLENYIFNYSSSNYEYNVTKIIFIFENYPEALRSFINGNMSNLELLTMETAKIIPENDLEMKTEQEKIDYLLSWSPDTSNYDTYKSQLDENDDIEKFKKDNTSLSLLEVDQIFQEYSEYLQWNNTLDTYTSLEFTNNIKRLRWLIKQRNKLPSRRIYRIASISDRINTQKDLEYIFETCELSNPKKCSRITETIIYKTSKSPNEYNANKNLIKEEYSSLCKYLTELNISTDDPFLLIPVITEFLLTNGKFSNVDKIRLANFITNSGISDGVLSYINNLRGFEIDIYHSILMDELNENVQNFIKKRSLNKILDQIRKYRTKKLLKDKLEEETFVKQNTYISPKISSSPPESESIGGGVNFVPDYIEINGFYITGGNYPNYETRIGGDVVINYSRENLVQLANIFAVPIQDDSFQLYINIMDKKSLLENKLPNEILVPEHIPGNGRGQGASDYYENLKMPTKKYKYTYRPRLGVKEPGEVYGVVKDLDKKYGIPFKYNNGIPVYSNELKQLVDDSFVTIEGPAIFEDEDQLFPVGKYMSSEYYILVEYLDSRGKPKMFREGVSEKSIKTRLIEDLDTCDRFKTEESCNDPYSYSLDPSGAKFKCGWKDNTCVSNKFDDSLDDFAILDVDFNDEELNKEWKKATEKSMESIEDYIMKNKLESDKIDEITYIEKKVLYEYYLKLIAIRDEKNKFNSPTVGVPMNSKTIIEIPEDVLGRKLPGTGGVKNITGKQTWVDEKYDTITIHSSVAKLHKYPVMNIELDKEYTIDDIKIRPYMYIKETDSYKCYREDNTEITLLRSQFKIPGNKLTWERESTFCYISKEDKSLLTDYPGYYWNISYETYDERILNEVVVKNTVVERKTFVPTSFIKPTPGVLLNGKPLIQKENILNAIYETAFTELETQDNYIYQVKTPASFATQSAIKFSVDHGIDLNGSIKGRVALITLSDVIQEYESLYPKPSISKKQLTEILQKAIDENDYNTLATYYYRARLNNLPKDLLKQAKEVIDNKPKEPVKETKLPEVPIPQKNENVVKNNLVPTRRRR